jgi:hypothetical protein
VALLEGPVLNLQGDGGHWLFGLLSASLEQLGFSLPCITFKSQSVQLNVILGRGRFSTVYGGSVKIDSVETKVVVKWIPDQDEADRRFNAEAANLARVASLAPGVPKLHGRSDCKCALLVGPPGNSFASSASSMIAALEKHLMSEEKVFACFLRPIPPLFFFCCMCVPVL